MDQSAGECDLLTPDLDHIGQAAGAIPGRRTTTHLEAGPGKSLFIRERVIDGDGKPRGPNIAGAVDGISVSQGGEPISERERVLEQGTFRLGRRQAGVGPIEAFDPLDPFPGVARGENPIGPGLADRIHFGQHAGVTQIDQDRTIAATDDIVVAGALPEMDRCFPVIQDRYRFRGQRRAGQKRAP